MHDYAPTGIGGASELRISSGSSSDFIGGIAGGTEGRILIIVNVGSANFDLKHADTGSLDQNKMIFLGSANVTIPPVGNVTLRYDGTSSRWRAIAVVI